MTQKKLVFWCWVSSSHDEDGATSIDANDAHDAAGLYAQELCADDPEWYDSFERTELVHVREPLGGLKSFRVRMECRPVFFAREV